MLFRSGHVDVLDRFGDTVASIDGEITEASELGAAVERHTRHRGPITLRPTIWIIDDRRLIELAADGERNPYAQSTADHASRSADSAPTYLVGRSR